LTSLSLFSYSTCGLPRDLHSFPTRRSSDLGDGLFQSARPRPYHVVDAARSRRGGRATGARYAGTRGRLARGAARNVHPHPRASRSEEHTSELQSRENLVCRLLLEKKKKNEI